MIDLIRKRIARSEHQGGFTLIELLVVIIIIGILLAIAVPSYLGFRSRANNNAAQANVRSAVPAAEAYYSDKGSYSGMTVDELKKIDSGLKVTAVSVKADNAKYCLQSTANGQSGGEAVHHIVGPGGAPTAGTCPDPIP